MTPITAFIISMIIFSIMNTTTITEIMNGYGSNSKKEFYQLILWISSGIFVFIYSFKSVIFLGFNLNFLNVLITIVCVFILTFFGIILSFFILILFETLFP